MAEPFDLLTFLPYRLAVLAERVSRRLAVEYEGLLGINVAEWRVLAHLHHLGPASVREIHSYTNLEKPKVSRAVARLESNGLVRKDAGETDGRLVVITLTPQGEAALDEILPVVTGIEARLLNALTDEERRMLELVSEKLHGALDADPAARPRLQPPAQTSGKARA